MPPRSPGPRPAPSATTTPSGSSRNRNAAATAAAATGTTTWSACCGSARWPTRGSPWTTSGPASRKSPTSRSPWPGWRRPSPPRPPPSKPSRLREAGSRLGLLSPLVGECLRALPPGALRPADLDTLLITERTLDPLVAAAQADRFLILATHSELRAEEDRLAEAETHLDDTLSPDDPRIEDLATRRCAHETALAATITASGLDESLDTLLDQNHDHPHETGTTTLEALAKTPYDFSPARIRYEERVIELLHPADQDDGDTPPSR